MGTAISWVMFAATLGGYIVWGHTPPGTDRTAVGTWQYVRVVNRGPDTMRVYALAPAVDSTVRLMGAVPPGPDTVALRLPYGSTNVVLVFLYHEGGRWATLRVP